MARRDLSKLCALALALVSLGASACDYPDEGTMPLHRAVTKVKLLPQTETWAAGWLRQKVVVQYALLLEQPRRFAGRCYWTLEARVGTVTWRRFYVTPDGTRVLNADGRPAAAPHKATASAAATARAR
jgi:hypothetical protein